MSVNYVPAFDRLKSRHRNGFIWGQCIGSPSFCCVSRGTWRGRGIKIRWIFRGSTFMADRRTGHRSHFISVVESNARGTRKRIEIRSIDARFVSRDSTIPFFSFSLFLPANPLVILRIACCSRIKKARYAFLNASANLSTGSKSFLSSRVCFNLFLFLFLLTLCRLDISFCNEID